MKTKKQRREGGEAAGVNGDGLSPNCLETAKVSPTETPEQQRAATNQTESGARLVHESGVNDIAPRRALEPVPDNAAPASTPPFDRSLLEQLSFTAQGGRDDGEMTAQRAHGAITLYQSFAPSDAAESVLARIGVALTNASMDSFDRAARPGQSPAARQAEVKLGVQTAAAVTGLMAQLDKHRGLGRQDVRVGNVNVGSGGRAIVGTVQAPSRASMKEPAANQDEVLVPPEVDSEAA